MKGGFKFETGVHKGSVLSPTLFTVCLNPLMSLLTTIGQKRGISHGIKGIDTFKNLSFTDDLFVIPEISRGPKWGVSDTAKYD